MVDVMECEQVRVEQLLAAEVRAERLFTEVRNRGLIRAGALETTVDQAIRALAGHFAEPDHSIEPTLRAVRGGPNTLLPHHENPPDRTITENDIVSCDFGSVTCHGGADFGRTFVLGNDPVKLRLLDALPVLFAAGRTFFDRRPEVTGAQLHAHLSGLAAQSGWRLGGVHAGHLAGRFVPDPDTPASAYIAPGNNQPLRRVDAAGRPCHWVLEIHLIDRARQIGGFYEGLLDLTA